VRKHRNAGRGNGSRGVILGGKDIARCPADFGPKRHKRFDENRRLDGHVKRAGDARALQRLGVAVLFAHSHQAGHFHFGDGNFLAAEIGQRDIGNGVIGEVCHGGGSVLSADLQYGLDLPRSIAVTGQGRNQDINESLCVGIIIPVFTEPVFYQGNDSAHRGVFVGPVGAHHYG
jgi:hypothetical protein